MSNHTNVTTGTTGAGDGFFAGVPDTLFDIGVFMAVVVAAFTVGRVARWIYDRSLRRYPTSGQLLLGKLMVLTTTIVGFLMALALVYQVQPLSLLATLGVVSLALGFGLQNTVANLAAGVGLTLDKPFEVGDRIRIGETWGDVVSIGLRSTRILTVNGDLVVVPNSILDTRELWNYTFGEHRKFRLDVPVGISYDSSIQLAESLMLEAARIDERVLAYPEPRVVAMAFGDSAIDLQLRVWLSDAKDRPRVRDTMIRGIKDRFDDHGVTIPFPQRTVSYLKELPEPAETPAFVKGEAGAKPVVLVCTRSRQAARAMSGKIVEFVAKLDARMVVLHVRRPQQAMSPFEAQAAVNAYMDKAQHAGVPARGMTEVGEFPKVLARAVRETGAKLVLFGKPKSRWLGVGWVRSEVHEAQTVSSVPVVLVDTDEPIPDEAVERWREHLYPPEDEGTEQDGQENFEEEGHERPEEDRRQEAEEGGQEKSGEDPLEKAEGGGQDGSGEEGRKQTADRGPEEPDAEGAAEGDDSPDRGPAKRD